jgi:hypothetical protein
MTKTNSQRKPSKPKPLSPELREMMHLIASLEKQPVAAKG